MRRPDELALDARGNPRTYRFRTADGVCSKDGFRGAELALLETLHDQRLGDLLCPEANYGVVGTVLADTADSVLMTESSARAAGLCERNAASNDADTAVSVLAELTGLSATFDTAAYAPKPYTPLAVGKQRLADSLDCLRPGGELYVAGREGTGIARYADTLRNLAPVERVASDGCDVFRATRPDAFDRPTYVTARRIETTVDGVSLPLVTVPGLFSAGSLDDGTRLLLETAEIGDGERVLDLPCGYGPIGAYADRVADCEVWLSDDDRVATRCAECTLDAAGAAGEVVTADCADGVPRSHFDAILCNPPTHAGEGVLSELLAGVHGTLAPSGRLLLVHHRSLDLSEHLRGFGSVRQRRAEGEHVVYEVSPSA